MSSHNSELRDDFIFLIELSRVAQEQCCVTAAAAKPSPENSPCSFGITMAREQGVCERPFFPGDVCDTKISKMCCDCCMLGLTAASQGSSCTLEGLLLQNECGSAANTCCSTNITEVTERPPQETNKPDPDVTTKPPGDTEACRDSICSQLCIGNGTCSCFDGYQLRKDGVTCDDVNECITGKHNCIFGQVCINTEGSFRCQREIACGTGYQLTDKDTCEDIDECASGTHNCEPTFFCRNTPGSFRCHPKDTCTEGYFQDAAGSCIDINECLVRDTPCPSGQTCVNTIGSYFCRRNTVTCGRGYLLSEDGMHCEDVDECRRDNVCGIHGCVNLQGSYRCECKAGYTFNTITKKCEDINECRHYPGKLCAHKCENTEGSFQCSCSMGFKLSHDGRNCDDVNECEANPCSQECANVYGSYQCYCRRGYQLSDIDGITCEDIDECALPAGGHVCSYHCSNAQGSFYCTCPPTGYTLAPNGRTCQDIDECATGTHTCSVSESCFNIHGGFRCLSFECPPNFRKAAQGNDVSVSLRCVKACQPEDFNCLLDPVHLVTHTALSLPTFRDLSKPEEIVFLQIHTPTLPSTLRTADISFEIMPSNDRFSFDVVKRFHKDMIMGVVRQLQPTTGPKDIILEVAMNYGNSGVVFHRNIVNIHIFISEFWF
uniref:Fibulin-1 n=1 Tax=Sphaeramia orbicularis TaxID=375764 RepID=A0A672Z2N7_9TELE